FFFSSRRRHTRSKRDWSSDVCSSDLTHMQNTTTTFEMMATKNNQLIHEINRTLAEVNQTFSQRDQQLSSHVNNLEGTLVNHVSKTESVLGEKLDTMIRNVNHSL